MRDSMTRVVLGSAFLIGIFVLVFYIGERNRNEREKLEEKAARVDEYCRHLHISYLGTRALIEDTRTSATLRKAATERLRDDVEARLAFDGIIQCGPVMDLPRLRVCTHQEDYPCVIEILHSAEGSASPL